MNKKTKRRVPLALKLNRLIVAIIFFVAVGLMLISYFVHGRQVDRFYYDLTERAALTVRQNIDPDSVSTLWKAVNTDEFRNLREKAVAANDEQMIIDWMETKPSSYGELTWQILLKDFSISEALKSLMKRSVITLITPMSLQRSTTVYTDGCAHPVPR